MRDTFSRTLYEVAKKEPKVVIIVADISPAASMEAYRKDYPDRFINVGVSEQSMVSLCSGLAIRGCHPFAYSIATFSTFRPFEHIRVELCYQNLPVTLVGVGGGVTYSIAGATHNANEDIAVLGALPNMTIIAPCDPLELKPAVWTCVQHNGPTYLRIGKAGEPNLTENAPEPFVFGKIRKIKEGVKNCIIGYGPILVMAFEAAEEYEKQGEPVSIYSVHTVKPLDVVGIQKVLSTHDNVIVIEEHTCIGGLGMQIKGIAWDHNSNCRIHTMSLKDEYIHCYGTHRELLATHDINPETILLNLQNQ